MTRGEEKLPLQKSSVSFIERVAMKREVGFSMRKRETLGGSGTTPAYLSLYLQGEKRKSGKVKKPSTEAWQLWKIGLVLADHIG